MMSEDALDVAPQSTSRSGYTEMSSQSHATVTARQIASTEKRESTHRSEGESLQPHTSRSRVESARSCMNTFRAHTALAALSAQKNALESRLAIVECALQAESKTSLIKKGRGLSNRRTTEKT